ncbi:MAG: HAD-IB family phosphatase [Chloroflexi bacterium]|nr:HAD-IB family phosphatase [Chloroflexota bacterium]
MNSNIMLGEGWDPAIREQLEWVIATYGCGGPDYDPRRPPAAAFDWDETVLEHDIGDALLFHQIDTLAFKWELPEFWELIPHRLRQPWQEIGRPLWKLGPEEIQNHPAYPEYLSIGYQLFRDMLVAPREIGYPWFTQVLAGFTVGEALVFSEATFRRESGWPLGRRQIVSHVSVRQGVRLRPTMVRLIKTLETQGFQVWVVSATNRWTVQTVASRVGIPPDRVIGMETEVREGRITTTLVEPAPYYEGKATALRARLGPSRLILAAGDSPSDESMISLAEAARLLINPRDVALRERCVAACARGEPWLIHPGFDIGAVDR